MSTLFNTTKIVHPQLILGETNGIMKLNGNKYDWSFKLYRTMMGNFWIK